MKIPSRNLPLTIVIAAAGALDATFGAGGKVSLTNAQTNQFANSAALTSDGHIIVLGENRPKPTTTNTNFLMMRFTPGGQLDPTFGGGKGQVVTDFFGQPDQGRSVVVDGSGRIIAAGKATVKANATADYVVARYYADGSLDTTFGTGGKIVLDFAGGNVSDSGQAVAIQPGDGKIIAGGAAVANGGYNVALARLMP